MRIAVAGGTGLMGTLTVDEARRRGHDTVVLARSTGIDVTSGAGLDEALAGSDVVIDVLNVTTLNADAATQFFTETTRQLLDAEQRTGIRHHIALSIVGVDRAPYAYYAGKRAQELVVEGGDIPWTVLRATQFHEFAPMMFERARKGPLHVAPRMRTQPVAAREVAALLVDLAEADVAGYVEIGGPREESLVDMIRAYAHAIGYSGWIPALSLPGDQGRAQRDGRLLPGPEAIRGTQTFSEWVSNIIPDS